MSVKISYKTINMGQKITKSWWRISVLPLRKFTHLNSSNQHKSLFFKKWFDLLDFTKEWWCTSFCFSVPRPSECALKQLLAKIFRSNLGLFSLKNSTSERFKAKTLNSLCDGTLSLEQDYQKNMVLQSPCLQTLRHTLQQKVSAVQTTDWASKNFAVYQRKLFNFL